MYASGQCISMSRTLRGALILPPLPFANMVAKVKKPAQAQAPGRLYGVLLNGGAQCGAAGRLGWSSVEKSQRPGQEKRELFRRMKGYLRD